MPDPRRLLLLQTQGGKGVEGPERDGEVRVRSKRTRGRWQAYRQRDRREEAAPRFPFSLPFPVTVEFLFPLPFDWQRGWSTPHANANVATTECATSPPALFTFIFSALPLANPAVACSLVADAPFAAAALPAG